MRWRTPAPAFTAAAAAILTLSCVAQPPVSPVAASPAEAEQPRPGGRVVTGGAGDLATLQPILVNDTTSGSLIALMYANLLQPDPNSGEPRPDMATFSQSADGLTYTFEIDPRAVWSDGRPVIAQDWYVAKKLVAMSQATVRKSTFQDIVGWKEFAEGSASEISGVSIDAADPKKFSVTLSRVSCSALGVSSYVLPAHVFGKYAEPGQADAIDRAPENTAPTVFSGPFKFKEWRPGDQVILTRNESYWKGAPLIEEYVRKTVADSNVVAAQLKTGELTLAGIQPADLADIEQQAHLKVYKNPVAGYTYIGWRTNSPNPGAQALADKRVRQALAYGLDVDTVIEAVLFGEGTKQVAHHPPVQWAYPDPATLNQYPYDQAKARELIEEAGYTPGADGIYQKDGQRISFSIVTNSGNKPRETLAQIAAEQYRAIGLDVTARFEAFQGLVTKLTEGSPEIEGVIIGWALGPEPDPYTIWHSSQIPDPAAGRTGFGFTFFKSEEMDRAIEEGRNPPDGDCSTAARKKHYARFNQILNEEQPYNFGFSNIAITVAAADLQNVEPPTFGILTHNVHEWWFRRTE